MALPSEQRLTDTVQLKQARRLFVGEHLPGALRGRRKDTVGGVCLRTLASARSDSTPDPPEPRRMVPQMEQRFCLQLRGISEMHEVSKDNKFA